MGYGGTISFDAMGRVLSDSLSSLGILCDGVAVYDYLSQSIRSACFMAYSLNNNCIQERIRFSHFYCLQAKTKQAQKYF
jgi:hypothetical protein